MNQYQQAILNVGSIIEPYDSDRRFPVFGFGGAPNWEGSSIPNHCFAINGTPENPEIEGVQNILGAYQATLPNITLSGPTYFGPILQEFLNMVGSQEGQKTYNVLLLLTDG